MCKPQFAKDIMVTKLVTLTPEIDVLDACQMLLKNRISGAPVVDREGRFLGTFSEKCCLSVMVKAAYDRLPSNEVRAFMETDVHTINEDTDLLSIAQVFLNTGQRRLPVLRGEQLVGQISRRDVLKASLKILDYSPNNKPAVLYLSALREFAEVPIA